MTFNPSCAACLAQAHGEGHPPPKESEPEPPLPIAATLAAVLIAAVVVGGWAFSLWGLVKIFG